MPDSLTPNIIQHLQVSQIQCQTILGLQFGEMRQLNEYTQTSLSCGAALDGTHEKCLELTAEGAGFCRSEELPRAVADRSAAVCRVNGLKRVEREDPEKRMRFTQLESEPA